MRILIAEDDQVLADGLLRALRASGYAVDQVSTGSEADAALTAHEFDLMILDLGLPKLHGFDVLRKLRARGMTLPVLILTAADSVEQRVKGLDLGADDYMAKPFALAELIARVRALGRRGGEAKPVVLRAADLTLDTNTRQARRAGKLIELTAREYRLLEFLMRSPGRVWSRMAIVEGVWDYDFDPGTNLVDVYVMRLREKVDAEFELKLLHTVRGVGYVMREPD